MELKQRILRESIEGVWKHLEELWAKLNFGEDKRGFQWEELEISELTLKLLQEEEDRLEELFITFGPLLKLIISTATFLWCLGRIVTYSRKRMDKARDEEV